MIELHHLTKRYGDVVAVDELTFQVHPGRVTGFLGPNGAGKSTTMRLILGLDRASDGHALIAGQPYQALAEPLREVGALLDAEAMNPALTARTHLRVAARSNGIPRTRVDELLEQVGLAAVAGRRIKGYSLGMRQRLGIATALLGDPAVLLFDEPVNGLDAEGVRWVRDLLRRLAAEGRTVLVSSHLMTEMQQTADHLLVIGRGRLIADAPTAQIVAGSNREVVRVRTPEAIPLGAHLTGLGADVEHVDADELIVTGASAQRVGEAALAVRAPLHELAVVNRSLEHAYMELTASSVEYEAGRDQ